MEEFDTAGRKSSGRIGSPDCLDQLAELSRRVSALERESVVLFGHAGQDGAVRAIRSAIDQHASRIGTLEQARWKLSGAVIFAGSATGIILFVVDKLLGK